MGLLCCYKRPNVSCKNKFFFYFIFFGNAVQWYEVPNHPKDNVSSTVKFLLKIPSWKRCKSVKRKVTFPLSCVISVCQSLLLFYVSCAMKQQSIINSTVCAICLLNRVLKQQTACANVCTWVIDALNRYKHKRKDYLKVYTTLDWGIKLQVTHWGTVGLVL